LTADDIWRKYFDTYYREIFEIEKPERDDVFRKSIKFDRPDYGNNIPYELFSVLTNMHHSQSQSKEELERQTEDTSKETNQDFWGEGSEEKAESNIQVHEPESEQHSSGEGKAAHGEKPQHPVPTELDLINAERESIHKQVIETRQDDDLKNETKHPIVEVDLEEPKQAQSAPQSNPPEAQPAETGPSKSDDAY
jgi:hypothetical protein